MQPKLLIATNNPGKVDELLSLLRDMPIELVLPAQVGLDLHVEEDGHTYADNAAKKAVAFAKASQLMSLADDSGLEVAALNGAPGLHSARYLAKSGATDADRRAYLLENLHGKERPWRARFRAALAIADPEGNVHMAEGECEGEIIPIERGLGGFGYDPIFLLADLEKTMAELDPEEKNRRSHRARAIENARPILRELLQL